MTNAVVIGGSIGGLLAGLVLAEVCDQVLVVERGELPDTPAARPGVPQGQHAHGLLAGGLQALEQLLPGLCQELARGGAPTGDNLRDAAWIFSGRRLALLPGGRWLLGRSMVQWLNEPRPALSEDFDIGVIAGSGGIGMGRLIAPGLPRPHDGVISVQETRVPGMRDHIVLPVSHTAMLFSECVVRQTDAYLERGCFERVTKLTS